LYLWRKEDPTNMYLSRHGTAEGPRWALDGRYLPGDFTLAGLLEGPAARTRAALEDLATGDPA
jgi:2-dehydro-3-deoxy-D-arabinonate dehydratase